MITTSHKTIILYTYDVPPAISFIKYSIIFIKRNCLISNGAPVYCACCLIKVTCHGDDVCFSTRLG